jgi:uncharacterized protein (TIGR04222 family)
MLSLVETLVKIPGPQFLWFYAGLIVVCIIAARWWGRRDTSTEYPLPAPDSLDPLTIAALQGGPMAVVHTVVFDLWNRGLVGISGEKSEAQIVCRPAKEPPGGPIHEVVCQATQTPMKISSLVRDKSFRTQIEGHLNMILQRLEGLHLFQTAADRNKAWLALFAAFGVVMLVGGTKLFLGLSRNKPSTYLIIMMAIVPFVLWKVLKPRANRPTQLGRQFLQSLQQQNAWMKDALEHNQMPPDSSPVMALAIFGMSALVGVAAFDQYQQAFAAFPGARGDGSWSGGSDFDSSSSDSSSSDGGGSDGGGGGCGGCGGGD